MDFKNFEYTKIQSNKEQKSNYKEKINHLLFLKRFFLLLLFPLSNYCQIPQYYSDIDFNQSQSIIESQLSNLITSTHNNDLPYTSDDIDTWDVLKLSDEVPTAPTSVFLVYGYDDTDNELINDYTRLKSLSCHVSGCSGLWNREHVFPKSLAVPPLDVGQPGSGTDVHNLRPCDGDMNSTRSNRVFQDGSGISHITTAGNWFPGDEWKGDVARIIMYMQLRYPSQCSASSVTFNSSTTAIPSLLLEWNANDPVSDLEMTRNDIIQNFQGNRNPFIDNPYLATLIYGGTPANDKWNTFSTEDSSKKSFSIYPTIADNYIFIESNFNGHLNYSIYDINGSKLSSDITESRKIPVSNLSSAVYLLRLSNVNNGNNAVLRFIKK
jgi:hypothetical protein